jgi:hypothetical protein
MRKIIFAFLILATIANLVILIIALTNNSSEFYNYRFVIGILFMMFGGLLTRQILSYRKSAM